MRTLLPLLALAGCTASLDPFVDNALDGASPGDTSEAVDTAVAEQDGSEPGSFDFADSASTMPLGDCIDDLLPSSGAANGTTAGAGNDFEASCGGDRGSDMMFAFVAPEAGRWSFSLSDVYFDTVLYVLDACDGSELTCADDEGAETVAVDLDAGEGVVVVIDAAGQGEGVYTLEAALANDTEGACGNGVDDDLDGLADCLDSDCFDKPACNEDCSDGIDNNSDGLTDCMDPNCSSTANCRAPCADGELTGSLPISFYDTTAGGGRDTDPTCGATSNARDRAYSFVAPADGTFTFDTAGSSYDTVLYILDSCGGAEIACNDDTDIGDRHSTITGPLSAGQRVIVVVDGFSDAQGDFQLNVY